MNENGALKNKISESQQVVIDKTIDFVKYELSGAEGGHDWWHIERVWKLAQSIGDKEDVDLFVVNLGALLHDIADSKFYDGDESVGPQKAYDFLSQIKIEDEVIGHVVQVIQNISFKGGNHEQKFTSPELEVIQDADRLDAMGAIGIARAFNYGGHKGREIYNPNVRPDLDMTSDEYKKSTSPTLNHFYEKLLFLKDRMNTKTGRSMAEHRHSFMEQYLEEFDQEWNGKR